MKKFLIPFVSFLLIYSCSSDNTNEKTKTETADAAGTDTLTVKTDSVEVMAEMSTAAYFREFLSALEKKDFQQFYSFISPDFSNPTSEIWYQAMDYSDESLEIDRPFSKDDWKKYYLNVFRKEFVETVSSLKLDEITKKESLESKLFENKKEKMKYKCYTQFDSKKKQELVINLTFEIYLEDEDLYSESAHIFHFKLDESGKPLFVKFMMAG